MSIRVDTLRFCLHFATGVTLILSSFSSSGQVLSTATPHGSRSAALGSTYVTLTDFWSSLNNPANVAAQTQRYAVGMYYESSYLINELSLSGLGITHTSKYINTGLLLSRYGISSYNQGNAAIIIGKNVGKGISVGGKICYNYIQVNEGYGSVAAFTGEFGISAQLSKSIIVGAHVVNPTCEKIGREEKEALPSTLIFGISYITPFGATICTDIEKPIEQKIGIHTGLEWTIYKGLCARAGFRTLPNLISIGIGYTTHLLTFDLSVSKHQTLGYSPQASAIIWLQKKTYK